MKASVLAVGSEMLGTTRVDTNSLQIARVLEKYGLSLVRKAVAGDDRDVIASTLRFLLEDSDVVLITGGLGPTEDDLTKEAVAQALELELVKDSQVLERIEGLFAARNLVMPAVNVRQAMVFRDHRTVANFRGTAPGFHLNVTTGGKSRHIWIFPGVPHELTGMIERDLEPWLSSLGSPAMYRRIVHIASMAESAVEEALAPYYALHPEPLTILASKGEIEIHLAETGSIDEAYGRLNAKEEELHSIFGSRIFGLDEDTLESVVGRELVSRGETLAVAESCTGGLLGSRITDVSGSSSYFLGGIVTYARKAKIDLLGVDPQVLDANGEVSPEVSIAMAQGARKVFSSTWGIGITGIAGPTGGSAEKPVGTVQIAVAGEGALDQKKFLFRGPRDSIKWFATQNALDMIRRQMLKLR